MQLRRRNPPDGARRLRGVQRALQERGRARRFRPLIVGEINRNEESHVGPAKAGHYKCMGLWRPASAFA
jgi:hypothetical protein